MRTVAGSGDFSADIEAILTPMDPFKLGMRGFWLLMFSDCDLNLCTSRLLESNSWSLTYDPSFLCFVHGYLRLNQISIVLFSI